MFQGQPRVPCTLIIHPRSREVMRKLFDLLDPGFRERVRESLR